MPEKKSKKLKIIVSQAFEELDAITQWFEEGHADLDEGLKKYERAMELSGALRERLEEAENRVTEIQRKASKHDA